MTIKAKQSFFKDIPEISTTRRYFFVRTDRGTNFDAFYNGGFIALGWDTIVPKDYAELSIDELKRKISKDPESKFDYNTKSGKSKATAIYTKILRFKELRKGDIIVMPSSGSYFLAFGEVSDHSIYLEDETFETCSYRKRREVNWLKKEPIDNLDPMFYRIQTSWQALFDISKYDSYIDRVLNGLFIKGDKSHLVIDIGEEKDIDSRALSRLSVEILELAVKINAKYNLDEEGAQIAIKVNVQSKGLLEEIQKLGLSIIFVGQMVFYSSCSPQERDSAPDEIKKEIQAERDSLDRINEYLFEVKGSITLK